jgi:hypothetical protein
MCKCTKLSYSEEKILENIRELSEMTGVRWKKINIIYNSSFVLLWGALVSGRGRYLSNWWSKNTEESDKYFTRKTVPTHATELLNTIATSYSVYRVQRASTIWSYITRIMLKFSLRVGTLSSWLLLYCEYKDSMIKLTVYLLWHSCCVIAWLSIHRRKYILTLWFLPKITSGATRLTHRVHIGVK